MSPTSVDQIKQHIANGDTRKALDLLVEVTRTESSDYESDALLLAGQYRQWEREVALGIDQSANERRRIETAIMNIADNSFATAQRPEPLTTAHTARPTTALSSGRKPINPWLIGGGVLVLLLVIILAFGGGNDDTFPEDTDASETSSLAPAQEDGFGEESATTVDGYNVDNITISTGENEPVNYFIQQSDGWVQTDESGNVRFTFGETDRDEESVYLYDEGRDMSLELNIAKGQVIWSENGGVIAQIIEWSGDI